MKVLTMIYEGVKGNRAVWFEFDKKKNEVKGEALWFKKSKITTRFPVGMIVEVEKSDTGYKFAEAEWGEVWDNELVNSMVLEDRINRESLSLKRTENKMKKELGNMWEDMTIKELKESLSHLYGKEKTNAIALILGALKI